MTEVIFILKSLSDHRNEDLFCLYGISVYLLEERFIVILKILETFDIIVHLVKY